MLTNQYNFSANAVTVTQVVANLGAMTGGTIIGYLSQMFGRRFSIIVASIIGGALIYPYGFVGSERVIAPAFFMPVANMTRSGSTENMSPGFNRYPG